jgi:hypothetical protein
MAGTDGEGTPKGDDSGELGVVFHRIEPELAGFEIVSNDRLERRTGRRGAIANDRNRRAA